MTRDRRSAGRPSVLAAVINWNGRDGLLACLSSLERLDYPEDKLRILVIDNGSRDGSPDAVKSLHSRVLLQENKTNLNVARASNQAVRFGLAGGFDYIWILNNDIIVEEASLRRLVDIGEMHKDIAVLSPVIYFFSPPGKEDHAGYRIDLWTGRLISLKRSRDIFRCSGEEFADVDSAQGCASLIKLSALGNSIFFRSIYKAYFEETDLHMRIKKTGQRVVVVRDSIVRHKKATSFGKKMISRGYLLLRNLILFEIYNARPTQMLVFLPYFLFIHVPWFLCRGLVFFVVQKARAFFA